MSARKGLVAVWRDTLRDSSLRSITKLAGLVLSTYMDGRGVAWPARKTIAVGGSLGVRSVDAAIDELERTGFVHIERSKGRSSHRYQATLPPTAHEMRRSEWATAQETAANRASHDTNGARRAPESGESAESTRASRDGRLKGAAASAPCETCGVGGGRHLADCTAVAA